MLIYENSKKEFIKLVESYSYRYRAWMIFSDFCKMTAISFYQPFIHDERLEEEYLEICILILLTYLLCVFLEIHIVHYLCNFEHNRKFKKY